MTALYTCLTANNLERVKLRGFPTSSMASVEFLENKVSTLKSFKLQPVCLLAEHSGEHQPDQQIEASWQTIVQRLSPIMLLEQVSPTRVLDPEIRVIVEE